MRNPKQINNLLQSAMARHGIGKQVQAAQVVTVAQALLSKLIQGPAAGECKVTSYRDEELVVDCKNAAAAYDIQGLEAAMISQLSQAFPNLTIRRMITRVRPGEWNVI